VAVETGRLKDDVADQTDNGNKSNMNDYTKKKTKFVGVTIKIT
jgi:hypothetical protein